MIQGVGTGKSECGDASTRMVATVRIKVECNTK